mmetsp:Transcript_7991/g.23612  ORF Transcript_7991/g.23612 Transcript_7991/m.23612 type:complete len:291 (+) Transcript_7991:868-1740(+)
MERLRAPLHLGAGKLRRVGAVHPRLMDQVQVGRLPRIGERRPGAAQVHVARRRRDHSGGDRLFELLLQEGRAKVLLLVGRLLAPLPAATRPRLVRGGVCLGVVDEGLLVDAAAREDGAHAHPLAPVALGAARAGEIGNVGVARAVDDALRPHSRPARLVFDDDARERAALVDRLDHDGVEERLHARVGDEVVGDNLEVVRVEALGRVEWPLDCPAHPGRHPFHLHPYARLALHHSLVAVPAERLHADDGDAAAKAAVPLDQHRARTRAGSCDRRRQAGRPATDNEHVARV